MTGASLSRERLEIMLVDYLYNELDARERELFEAALVHHPDLQAEVEEELALLGRAAALSFEERAPQAALDVAMVAARGALSAGAVAQEEDPEGGRELSAKSPGGAEIAGVGVVREAAEPPGGAEIAGVRVVREAAEPPGGGEIAGVRVVREAGARQPSAREGASWIKRALAWLTTPPVMVGAVGLAVLAVAWVSLPTLLGGRAPGSNAGSAEPAPVLVRREVTPKASPALEEAPTPAAPREAAKAPVAVPGGKARAGDHADEAPAANSALAHVAAADAAFAGSVGSGAPVSGALGTKGVAGAGGLGGGSPSKDKRALAKALPRRGNGTRPKGTKAKRANAKRGKGEGDGRATLQVASAGPAARLRGAAPMAPAALPSQDGQATPTQVAAAPAAAKPAVAKTATGTTEGKPSKADAPASERPGGDAAALAKKVEERLASGDLAGARAALKKLKRLGAWRKRAKELAQAVAAAEQKAAEAAPPTYSNRPAASKRKKAASKPSY